MKKKIVQAAGAVLASVLLVSPILAAPSVQDLKEDKAEAETEVSSLQKELADTLEKIKRLEDSIVKKQEEIDIASERLEEAANKQAEQYDSMKLRIKYMYEEGNDTVVETLLSAENFSDFVNKAEYIQDVHAYDRDKLEEFEKTTKKVEKLRDGLKKEADVLRASQRDLETEKANLNDTIESKKTEIATLDGKIREALEARKREEEARRKKEQEARRREEEARRRLPAGPSSGGGSSYVPPQGGDGMAVVNYARQFIGNPYVYGGNSLTNGIDCSGFTQQIYAAFGVSLGRTTWDQEKAGVEIPFSQARAGDLILYEGHVGIYNGSGGLVHASSPSVGIIESGSCTYRPIKTVRRVL